MKNTCFECSNEIAEGFECLVCKHIFCEDCVLTGDDGEYCPECSPHLDYTDKKNMTCFYCGGIEDVEKQCLVCKHYCCDSCAIEDEYCPDCSPHLDIWDAANESAKKIVKLGDAWEKSQKEKAQTSQNSVPLMLNITNAKSHLQEAADFLNNDDIETAELRMKQVSEDVREAMKYLRLIKQEKL